MFKIVLLTFLLFSVLQTSLSSVDVDKFLEENEDNPEIMKFLINLGWTYGKLKVIRDSINTLVNEVNVNVTLVAWQNIHDKNGNLIEIRTIEFAIPKKDKTKPIFPEETKCCTSSEDDDEDIWTEIVDMINEIEDLAAVDMRAEMTYDKYYEDGSLEEAAYLEKDYIYIFYEGVGWLNRTLHVTNDKVEKYVNEKKDSQIPISVLTYDVDGNLVESKSKFSPITLTSVDYSNAGRNITKAALESFTLANIQHPSKIPKYFVKYMKDKVPNYKWFVTRETDAIAIKDDFIKVTLKNELIYYDVDYVPYTLYGIKK